MNTVQRTQESNWRGPFAVKVDKWRGWKIVNRHGDTERTGYRDKSAANKQCGLMNLAHDIGAA